MKAALYIRGESDLYPLKDGFLGLGDFFALQDRGVMIHSTNMVNPVFEYFGPCAVLSVAVGSIDPSQWESPEEMASIAKVLAAVSEVQLAELGSLGPCAIFLMVEDPLTPTKVA